MPEVSARPAGTPTWFDLTTGRPEEVKPFYTALFGWDFEDYGPALGHYHRARVGGADVAGLVPKSPDMPGMPSAWSVYFRSDDAQADATRIRNLGGQVMVEPMQVMELGHMLVASDPTGAVFGMWQPLEFHGSALEGEHGSMTWQEVNTRDSGQALTFYTGLLGATSQPLTGVDYYYMLQHGPDDIAGILQMDEEHWPPSIPSHWMPYFAVNDVHEAVRVAADAGGTVSVPPFESPYGTIAVLSDPDNAVFSVIQLSQTP
ncbi:VOC family protein [Deinococcus koreensis]|uniref:VOC family protein n=1 Tax=Deinococcus koreensis TaxID=2054903 RepID=A0A2K3UZ19_9DEIO|nr:VOC family protein [Deinococcus koreensis]PNY81786.1 VOC family protein [Deinococcus koreensis]